MRSRIFAIALAVLVVIFGTYVLHQFHSHAPTSEAPSDVIVPSLSDTPTSDSIATSSATGEMDFIKTLSSQTKGYVNLQYKFSLSYPAKLTFARFIEGGRAITVTFQTTDQDDPQGFQIFIVPYGDKLISRARFQADDPSMVMNDAHEIQLGGVEATQFYSESSVLGETVEIWSINNGYLYEISAPKALEVWLGGIMSTWAFL
jgi:hypothetical protein